MCCAIPLYRTHVFVITFVPDLYKAVRIYPVGLERVLTYGLQSN